MSRYVFNSATISLDFLSHRMYYVLIKEVFTIQDRILALISALKISKTKFAARLDLSPAFVSQICAGVRAPSDRTISDICREFDVSEEWLRTGKGEMFVKLTRSEELARFAANLQREDEDSFPRQFVEVLAKLDQEDWAAIKRFMQKLLDKQKTDP